MTVSLAVDNDIALITIDDGHKNVINHEVLDELEHCWAQARAAKCTILQGRPGSFCAGYDITVMTGSDPTAARDLGHRGGKFAYALYSSDKPVVAVCTGHAFTIGAVWLACCDVRIGEQGAYKYGMSEVALGVAFSAWPLQPMKARLNPAQHIPALLHSRIYTPEEAVSAGFIDELQATGGGAARGLEVAAQLAELPQAAYAKSKHELHKDALAIMAADLGIEP